MNNTYHFLYCCSLAYFAIGGIFTLVGVAVMLYEKQHYMEQLGKVEGNNVVRFIVALLTPVIFGLGWIFFLPSVVYNLRNK